ncbi:substrate-binding domain-containing protein [Tsuneonella suprasediminis]|uniref:Phosphate ABC transporter substrate-binding protein n=1 Tax=Tsuneonella suprasediminis TaxID=2306996 RepID=A0A419R5Y6_9SPHN|nr:substrate-binding domain-containing protein [Tsuneonella suprasediminis]RJX71267.1 phosphate ABC transporter substrate-binding protein [Tsuneonella suprasediminis]
MKSTSTFAIAAISALALTACGSGGSTGTRDSIRAVGSSTVYPFAKKVAEDFTATHPQFKSPLIESTGTGGGMKLFCAGLGANTPDIEDASRRMKKAEFEDCQKNGVTEVIELQVGLDGIAFASSKGGITMNLTPKIVYEALAAKPYGKAQTTKTWKDVDPSLPNEPILMYGPPSTSGTRDALKELILEKGCESNPEMQALKESDKDKFAQVCTEVRSDGAYVDSGEQDNLIVQKIENNRKAIGVFGYSYLEENLSKLQDLPMNGVDATYDNISSFKYPGARPLYVYYKKQHVGVIPGLKEFIDQWTKSWTKGGPLAKVGFIASPDDVQAANLKKVQDGTIMTAEGLE